MKIDTSLLVSNLSEIPAVTCRAEELSFNRIWTAETAYDPFLTPILAAEHSQRLTLDTRIAQAFPRSPVILVYLAWDLPRYSNGRFILGLGTQVKDHYDGVRF
jgi:alkanesulfonate monooxygenase SsuD/methylene tetrahydromethanopterin reductase-like flavin-dependent oxidoreductase (luciferase family)